MEKTALLILTHFIDRNILEMFRRLRAESSSCYDVFIVLNLGEKPLQVPPEGRHLRDSLYLCNTAKLLALAYPEKCKAEGWNGKGWNIEGNVDTLELSFFRDYPGYAYYWAIEYDVHFEGRWGFLFERFESSDADFLAVSVRPASAMRWKVLKPPFLDAGGREPDYKEAVVCFLPLHRGSNRFYRALDEDYRHGCNGHHEFTLGTTAKRHGLSIEDIGGNGPYVKPHNRRAFYFSTMDRWDMAPGTFIFRPAFTKVLKQENTIWHPVKPEGEYDNHSGAAFYEKGLQFKLRYYAKYLLYGLIIRLWFRFFWRPATHTIAVPQMQARPEKKRAA